MKINTICFRIEVESRRDGDLPMTPPALIWGLQDLIRRFEPAFARTTHKELSESLQVLQFAKDRPNDYPIHYKRMALSQAITNAETVLNDALAVLAIARTLRAEMDEVQP